MKKEVSDHIARTFLENKTDKKRDKSFFPFIVLSLGLVIGSVSVTSFLFKPNGRNLSILGERLVLEKHDGPHVLNFNFSDSVSKLGRLTIDIPEINLSAYKKLRFSVRLKDADIRKLGRLKVVLMNRRKETSSLYISEVDNSWKEIVLPLSDFKNIRTWSDLAQLSFAIEEWNLYPKKGSLLIDDIEFSRN